MNLTSKCGRDDQTLPPGDESIDNRQSAPQGPSRQTKAVFMKCCTLFLMVHESWGGSRSKTCRRTAVDQHHLAQK